MKLYYCSNCRRIWREEDLTDIEESRGEFWGRPCYETFAVCPECLEIPSEYVEPIRYCKDCDYFTDDGCKVNPLPCGEEDEICELFEGRT